MGIYSLATVTSASAWLNFGLLFIILFIRGHFRMPGWLVGRVTKQLVAALEQGLRAYPQMSGGFLQVSGLTFVFDPGRPVGERVVEVKVGGEPVDYGRT